MNQSNINELALALASISSAIKTIAWILGVTLPFILGFIITMRRDVNKAMRNIAVTEKEVEHIKQTQERFEKMIYKN